MIFFIGVAGYMIIEKWNFLDAAYMTALTVTTVGFMEVHQTSDAGKIFTIFVMIAGVGYFLYITGIIIQAVVEGEVQTLLGRKRLDKKISKLKKHYIICGYGRIGRVLCRLIKDEKKDLVVIEKDDDLVEILEKDKLVEKEDLVRV